MDHLPLAVDQEPPRPRLHTLALLVGRVTTIKLGYWAALTVTEAALPLLFPRPFAERLPISIVIGLVVTGFALGWTRVAARSRDRVAGLLVRSVPTIATTFAATTVVASPASLPLLILERERSLEDCGSGTCHFEAILLWVAILLVGTIVIPFVFALSMHTDESARSLGD